MSVLIATEYGPGVLGDDNDSTYTDDSATNSGASPQVVTLRVAFQLAITNEHGVIESVTFAARASKGSDLGTWGDARITMELAGVDPVTIVTIPEGLFPLVDVESASQVHAPDGSDWTWQKLADTTIAVEADVTLDPGETATLRVGKGLARVYAASDRPFSLLVETQDDTTLTVTEDDATLTTVEGD